MKNSTAKLTGFRKLTGFSTSPVSHVLSLPNSLKAVKVVQASGAIAIIVLSALGFFVVHGLDLLLVGLIISMVAGACTPGMSVYYLITTHVSNTRYYRFWVVLMFDTLGILLWQTSWMLTGRYLDPRVVYRYPHHARAWRRCLYALTVLEIVELALSISMTALTAIYIELHWRAGSPCSPPREGTDINVNDGESVAVPVMAWRSGNTLHAVLREPDNRIRKMERHVSDEQIATQDFNI